MIKMSDGTVYPVVDGFDGVRCFPSIKQERHFFNHSTMRQDEAVYPVDPALRCVGNVDEDDPVLTPMTEAFLKS